MSQFIFTVSLFVILTLCLASCETDARIKNETNQNIINVSQNTTLKGATSAPAPTVDKAKVSSDPLSLKAVAKLRGVHLKAVLVAYEAFKTDSAIPEEKRNIENYDVNVREDNEYYYVLFDAGLAPGEKPQLGGESSVGMDTMFYIRKKGYFNDGRTFFK